MHAKGPWAPHRKVLAVLFTLFALVFSSFPSVDLPAVQAQEEDASPILPAAGMTAYSELDTLVVIYTNTAAGNLNPTDVTRLKEHVRETTRFIWKQSHFKFFMRLIFKVINTYKDITEFTEIDSGIYWLNPTDDDGDGKSVEADLLARGVRADQYDSIHYLWAHNNGTLPAANDGAGMLIDWRLGKTGITEIPVFQPSGSEKFSTTFPLNIQRTIDAMMDDSGYPQYFNADRPWDYSGAFGEEWSFWEYQMKQWPLQNWLGLRSPWGDILQAPDADGDGVPDSGAGLPITERSLGSSARLADTDKDGLADLEEATTGLFRNANLKQPDTDGDGAPDGRDPAPLYPVNQKILKKTLALDGNPAGWDILTTHLEQTSSPFTPIVYANWDENFLYLMFYVEPYAGIHVMIDANADGWYSGNDNYFLALDPSYPDPSQGLNEAHIWDSSDSVIAINGAPMWDSYPDYPFERLITPESVGRYSRSEGAGFFGQLAIPRSTATGMVPQHGKRIGLRFSYDYIGRLDNQLAETFEPYDFAYVTLWDSYSHIVGSAGMSGVTLTSFGDGATSTMTSDQNGNYVLRLAQGWSGTVTPWHPCFNFDPPSRSYSNLVGDRTQQDFTSVFNTASGCVNVNVSVGGLHQGSFGLPPETSLRTSFAGVNGGPVQIVSGNSLPLVGAERVLYKVNGVNTSYSELMGLPNHQLDTTYWLPWYNNIDLDTQLRIGNASNTTATVRVHIAGVEMVGSPFTIAPGESIRLSFANVNGGPVKIASDVNIVASQRVIYKVNGIPASYSEMMAQPESQLDTTYWLALYDHTEYDGTGFDSQLRFANASNSTATVRIYIRDFELEGSPFTLPPGASTRVSFPGLSSGPVKIVSDAKIVVSKRVIFKSNETPTSYSEIMAFPNRQLDTTYWLPWFNRLGLGTAIRFTNLSGQPATVRVYLGGVEQDVSPFTMPPDTIYYTGFDASSGPLKITSDVNIMVDTVISYSVNRMLTSYTELMALPNSQLDTTYWFPWYNNIDLDTQLRFGVP